MTRGDAGEWSDCRAQGVEVTRSQIRVPQPGSDGAPVVVEVAVAHGLVREVPGWVVLEEADEERLRRLRQEADRRRFLTGRAVVTALTREVCGVAAEGWRFVAPPREAGTTKPCWVGAKKPPRVSLSHSDDVVVVALCGSHGVGVDVESVAGVAELGEAGLAAVLRPEELAAVGHREGSRGGEVRTAAGSGRACAGGRLGVPGRAESRGRAAPRTRAAAELFTAKEAVLKAVGWGFAVDPLSLLIADGRVVDFAAPQARPVQLARLRLPEARASTHVAHVAVVGEL